MATTTVLSRWIRPSEVELQPGMYIKMCVRGREDEPGSKWVFGTIQQVLTGEAKGSVLIKWQSRVPNVWRVARPMFEPRDPDFTVESIKRLHFGSRAQAEQAATLAEAQKQAAEKAATLTAEEPAAPKRKRV